MQSASDSGPEIQVIESDSDPANIPETQPAPMKRKIEAADINLDCGGSTRRHVVGEPSFVKEEKSDIVESYFISQCRPKGLVDLVSAMTEKQKDDVMSIGFGFILDLRLKRCSNQNMLRWLIDKFNSVSRVMYIDKHRFFPITTDDIYDVLMLPRNIDNPVLRYSRKEDGSMLCNHLNDKYKIKSGVPLTFLFDILKSQFHDGG
ncbi:hypothetical protein ACS0TY_012825 [Phlomoides rotata]